MAATAIHLRITVISSPQALRPAPESVPSASEVHGSRKYGRSEPRGRRELTLPIGQELQTWLAIIKVGHWQLQTWRQ